MVRVTAWLGAIAFWIVQLGLLLLVGLPMVDTILLAVLLVAVPAFSVAQLPLVEGAEVQRLPAYWGSIATLWLLGTACWLVGGRAGGPGALGLVALAPVEMAWWSLGLTLGGLVTLATFRQLAAWAGVVESPTLRQLIPRTRQEKSVFALLSFAAGSAEELAYRGYVIPMLAPLVGVTGSALLSSAVFGVLHSYQGALGTARTAVLGGILAWGFLASGSLWPAIIAHTAIDLLAGLVLGDVLLPPEGDAGVTEGAVTMPRPDTR